jgi:hypothetical protein
VDPAGLEPGGPGGTRTRWTRRDSNPVDPAGLEPGGAEVTAYELFDHGSGL